MACAGAGVENATTSGLDATGAWSGVLLEAGAILEAGALLGAGTSLGAGVSLEAAAGWAAGAGWIAPAAEDVVETAGTAGATSEVLPAAEEEAGFTSGSGVGAGADEVPGVGCPVGASGTDDGLAGVVAVGACVVVETMGALATAARPRAIGGS